METLLLVLDLVGTFVFALSGAMAGVRHRLDLFGVLVLSYAAGNAGGIPRDLLIGAVPSAAISDWRYLAVFAAGRDRHLLAAFCHRPAAQPGAPVRRRGAGALRGCRHAEGARLRAHPGHGGASRHVDRDRRRHDPRCAPGRDSHRVARRSLRRPGCAICSIYTRVSARQRRLASTRPASDRPSIGSRNGRPR
jgi:Glycine transporter